MFKYIFVLFFCLPLHRLAVGSVCRFILFSKMAAPLTVKLLIYENHICELRTEELNEG